MGGAVGLMKQAKDVFYMLSQEPTLERFRDFLRGETGEHNEIDFKQEWVETPKLAKLVLALANYGGGAVVFGVEENKQEGTFSFIGLEKTEPKEQIDKKVRPYIPESLKYDIYDFSYRSSEYKALEGKSFQILIVENTPEYIPFVSREEGTGIEVDTIYIRRGTSNERANSQELDEMFRKHMQHIYPQTGEPLDLQEHLRQLKILYENIAPTIISYENSPLFESIGWLRNLPSKIWGEKKEEDNPLYPEESYEQFIANMIDKKKNKIERVLDLR